MRRSPISTCCRRSASSPGSTSAAIAPWTDGQSLVPLLGGAARSEPVLMEYAAEGSPRRSSRSARAVTSSSIARSIRRNSMIWNRIRSNCSTSPPIRQNAALVAGFLEKVRRRWDMAGFDAAVRESQARRWVVYPALRNGA